MKSEGARGTQAADAGWLCDLIKVLPRGGSGSKGASVTSPRRIQSRISTPATWYPGFWPSPLASPWVTADQLRVANECGACPEPACQPKALASGVADPPSGRILVVEDEDFLRHLFRGILVRAGYEVETAVDGFEGWERIRRERFDVLLTDHNMPGMTGLELIAKVRGAEIPMAVIVATATLPEPSPGPDTWLDIAAILLKPFLPEELLVAVAMAIATTGSALPKWGPPLVLAFSSPRKSVISGPWRGSA
jgi:CheY-like chemotaxis protein